MLLFSKRRALGMIDTWRLGTPKHPYLTKGGWPAPADTADLREQFKEVVMHWRNNGGLARWWAQSQHRRPFNTESPCDRSP